MRSPQKIDSPRVIRQADNGAKECALSIFLSLLAVLCPCLDLPSISYVFLNLKFKRAPAKNLDTMRDLSRN